MAHQMSPFTKMHKKFRGRKTPVGREKKSGFLVLFPMASFKVQIHIHHWIYRLHAHENVDGPFSVKNSLGNKIGIKLHTLQAGPMMSQPTDVCILSYVYLLKYK